VDGEAEAGGEGEERWAERWAERALANLPASAACPARPRPKALR
jgi:hypothetical protein